MEGRRALSRRLYRVLDEVGGSEELRQLHQETATVREITDTVIKLSSEDKGRNCFFHCGSSFEGTVTPDLASDRDIIECCSYIPVVHDIRDAPHGNSCLIVRESYTYPGYVKLQWVSDGQPLTAQHGMSLQQINCVLDSKGRVCLKHIKHPRMKGPAVKTIDECGRHVLDQVPAFRCATIPPFARTWFQQQRIHQRLSEEQVQQMSSMGCMFVGAGHVNSMEKDIEWRMSFSLQERLLMSNLNAVQHKVYLLLKMIKKNILEDVFKDETLTSYHCKTCVLFTIQMTPAHSWIEENLISCLLQCLKLLVKWLERQNCPNYFVPDQNLFVKAGFSRHLGHRLLDVIRFIVEGDTRFENIFSDNVGNIMRQEDCRRYRELSVVKVNGYIEELKLTSANAIVSSIWKAFKVQCHDPVSLASTLNILQRTESINAHTTEVTQSSLAYIYSWLHLHLAKGLISLVYRYPDAGNHRQQLMRMADLHLNEARDADLVNARLTRVTMLFRAGQFEECFTLLKVVEDVFIRHVPLICPCTRKCNCTYANERDKHLLQGRLVDLPLRQAIKSLTASCVVFLPSEFEITPVPFHHEMRRSHDTLPGSRDETKHYWFDWAVVDPRIYLYFMQYLVSCKLNNEQYQQEALYKLRMEIEEDDRFVLEGQSSCLFHKDTAYNLLGWIHAQEGRPADAWRCFSESWKIRPDHNAAKFHAQALVQSVQDITSNI